MISTIVNEAAPVPPPAYHRAQLLNSLVEGKRINCDLLQQWARGSACFTYQLFGDRFWLQKSTQAQQLSSDRIGLLNMLKVQRPGSSHRFRMIAGYPAPTPQPSQISTMCSNSTLIISMR